MQLASDALDIESWSWTTTVRTPGSYWPVQYWKTIGPQETLSRIHTMWDFYRAGRAVEISGIFRFGHVFSWRREIWSWGLRVSSYGGNQIRGTFRAIRN